MKKITALLLFVLFIPASHLFGQDVEKEKKEIEYLRQMPVAVGKVLASINATNFGPFHIEGRCGYDSHWYCFGDCFIWTWSWNFPNFSWIKDELRGRYTIISSTANSFDANFLPVKTWLLNSLPQFIETYQTQSAAIKGYQAAFTAHAGNQAEQDADKANIIKGIEKLNTALTSEEGTITQGIRNLSAFDRQMGQDLSRVKDLNQTMETSISSNQKTVWEKTDPYPCDKDYARNKVVEIQNSVRNQFNNVVANAEAFGLNAGKIDASSSVIIADLVIIQNKYQGAIASLQKAGSSPNTILQNLNLEITYKFYLDLAAFARDEFK